MEERWGSRGQDFQNRHGHSPFAMCWDVVLHTFKSARRNASPKARLSKSRIWLYIGNMWQMPPLLGYQSNISSSSKPHCLYCLLRTWQRCHSSLWAFPPPITSVLSLEKHQTNPNRGASYKIPEQIVKVIKKQCESEKLPQPREAYGDMTTKCNVIFWKEAQNT